MRVLIASRYVAYPSWQGPAQHARTFAKALLKKGHQVLVVSGEDVPGFDTIEQDGYRLARVPMSRGDGKLESLVSVASRPEERFAFARQVLRDWRPDVVHIGVSVQMGPFVEVAKEFGIPVVAMVHDYAWLCMTKFLVDAEGIFCDGPESVGKCGGCALRQLSPKRQLAARGYQALKRLGVVPSRLQEKWGSRLDVVGEVSGALDYLDKIRGLVDLFIMQTPVTEIIFRKYRVNPRKLVFVGQWLSEEKLRRYHREQDRKPGDKIRLGFVGRLDQEKGLHVLGEALRLLGRFGEIELWILSSGGAMEKVQKLTGGLPLDVLEIRIFDQLQGGAALPETIAQLDLAVVPSIWCETGPRVLLEAVAQKVPCIASDGVGNSYVITDGVNGRLFRMGDAEALARVLREVLDAPELLARWREALPAVMGEGEWFDMVLAVHERAIAEAGAGKDLHRAGLEMLG